MESVLVYGYGNPGRQDDGLGISCAANIDRWVKDEKIDFISTDQNYQLNIEDADRIANFDTVIFTDASVADIESFRLERIDPDERADFTMHSVSPAFVLGLCGRIFNKKPKCYQLHIRGYEFGFMEEMSSAASENLSRATAFLQSHLKTRILR